MTRAITPVHSRQGWMRRLSTSTEKKKARSAAHVKVLETAEELQHRQAAFPSQKCRGTHERVWQAAGLSWSRGRGASFGIGLLQLEVLVGARRRRKRRTWLEASGDLGLVLPASAAQGAMGQCGETGPTHGFWGRPPTCF
jgi:hypothetical protein